MSRLQSRLSLRLTAQHHANPHDDPPSYDIATDAAQQTMNMPNFPPSNYNTFQDHNSRTRQEQISDRQPATDLLLGILGLIVFVVFMWFAIGSVGH
jgi:hypothetical protein